MNKLLYDIRTAELLTLVSELDRQYKAAASKGLIAIVADAVLLPLFRELESKYAELLLASSRTPARATVSASTRRETLLRSLKHLLSGYALFPDKAKQDGATRLLEIVKQAGTEGLFQPGLSPTLAILPDIGTLLTAIKEAEALSLTEKHSAKDSLAVKVKNATDLKRPLVAVINEKLVPYLNAVGKNSSYEHFAAAVAMIINHANATVLQRKKARQEAMPS